MVKVLVDGVFRFQFPSNGKVYSKTNWGFEYKKSFIVSIPFKRESVFKDNTDLITDDVLCEFQFPSNGKVYSKTLQKALVIQFKSMCFNSLQTGKCIQSNFKKGISKTFGRYVSIPFKRESVFKGQCRWRRGNSIMASFNSLQTGKCIQRKPVSTRELEDLEFQFPSNGKVYSKDNNSQHNRIVNAKVSIPFKRESVFKDVL